MTKIPFGPSYDEMLDPGLIDKDVRANALAALHENELDPINLFNITWKDAANRVRKVVLPSSLTGIDANVVVMLGNEFPSGSHKVGAAYSTLIEGMVDGEISPRRAHHSWPIDGKLRHRHSLYLETARLSRHRDHA